MNEEMYRLIKAVCLVVATLSFAYYAYYSALAGRYAMKDWAIIDKIEQIIYEPTMAPK